MKKITKYTLLVANIFPVLGVIFFKWNIAEVLFIYFSETIIFFFLNLTKIFFLKNKVSSNIATVIFYALFFTIFLAAIGGFIFIYHIKYMTEQHPEMYTEQIVKSLFTTTYFANLAIFLFSHIYSYIFEYIKKKEYTKHTAMTLIKNPVLRIWILVIVTLGGFLIDKYIGSAYVMILFIALRSFIDWVNKKDQKLMEQQVTDEITKNNLNLKNYERILYK